MQLNCRRGLSEVEALLMAYWQQLANKPTDNMGLLQECQLFERLLMENDQQLFEWLLSPAQAPTDYRDLITRIRAYYLEK
jgi:succinate dehydrogenase flavin-adding protein (antitoxin of CptAB toxin-antitoxin module)